MLLTKTGMKLPLDQFRVTLSLWEVMSHFDHVTNETQSAAIASAPNGRELPPSTFVLLRTVALICPMAPLLGPAI